MTYLLLIGGPIGELMAAGITRTDGRTNGETTTAEIYHSPNATTRAQTKRSWIDSRNSSASRQPTPPAAAQATFNGPAQQATTSEATSPTSAESTA